MSRRTTPRISRGKLVNPLSPTVLKNEKRSNQAAGVTVKYGSVDEQNEAKMPDVPMKVHFTEELSFRDLGRFRPSPLGQTLMGLVRFVWRRKKRGNRSIRG